MTECYAMVRARVMRVTSLTAHGSVTSPVRALASATASRIAVEERSDGGSTEADRQQNTDELRVVNVRSAETVGFGVAGEFARVNPQMLSMMTGVPVVYNALGDVVGYDSDTHLPITPFALEVWSQLAGRKEWGYTVFPHLAGGMLAGFAFGDGLVSFQMSRAVTVRHPRWGVGPYDMTGYHERLTTPVSGNTWWRNFVTEIAPPVADDEVVEFMDRIDNGGAASPHPLRAGSLDGGSAAGAGAWNVIGGWAS